MFPTKREELLRLSALEGAAGPPEVGVFRQDGPEIKGGLGHTTQKLIINSEKCFSLAVHAAYYPGVSSFNSGEQP